MPRAMFSADVVTNNVSHGKDETVDMTQNLLVNPDFTSLEPANDSARYVAGWNVEQHGDLEALPTDKEFKTPTGRPCMLLRPGKKAWQFFALADLDENLKGKQLSLGAEIYQKSGKAVAARLSLMGVESSDGSWKRPNDFGDINDSRTYPCHGRGELVPLDTEECRSPDSPGSFNISAEGLTVDWNFKTSRTESSADWRNAVGIRVEFENVSDKPVLIRHPVLNLGKTAMKDPLSGRPLPEYYRQIPRTMEKLMKGEPVNIMTLGSSIDRGAQAGMLFDENPKSPTYKQFIALNRPFRPDLVKRPDLDGYIGWFQHYFMYTGRMRLELMKKFGLPADNILLNVMALSGSSMGPAHSGFAESSSFAWPPHPEMNAHAEGKDWKTLYPRHFKDGRAPAPDLVVFGHGHNARIDNPDEVAVFEGAIRWFQRHYPGVEFIICMWINPDDRVYKPMKQLCSHYGIPFIDVARMIAHLKTTANYYALVPDGGHPAAGAHYLWFKQLEKTFEVTSPIKPPLPQNRMPPRMNEFSYLWEGDMVTFKPPHSRIVDKRMMIVEDGPFNIWAYQDTWQTSPTSPPVKPMKILIDGKESSEAGGGGSIFGLLYYGQRARFMEALRAGKGDTFGYLSAEKESRDNVPPDVIHADLLRAASSFAHGHLTAGDRHIFEIFGNNPEIFAVDNKVAPKKQFYQAGDAAWVTKLAVNPFRSSWGHPYGDKLYELKSGESVSISASGDILSIAWLDDQNGGTFQVTVDGKPAWEQKTDVPFVTSDGKQHFIENRRAISGLASGKHNVTIAATAGTVKILGLYSYYSR
jgi:hypothetical protein